MPADSKELYFNWLALGESFERTGQLYGASRGNVYKRIRRFQRRLAAGCTCESWRCHCG